MKTRSKDDRLKKLNAEILRLMKQVTFSIEIITPDIARSYLKRNMVTSDAYRNRTVSARAIKNYMKDMLSDRWKTVAPILFDVNSGMIDGQQRCHAVLKSGVEIISFVIRGIDLNTFDVIDGGKRRTYKDALTALTVIINGKTMQVTKPAGVSAGINMLYSLEKYNSNIDKNRGLLTNSEMVEIVRNNFEYYDNPFKDGSIAKWKKNIDNGIKESIFAAFYYKNKAIYNGDIESFLTTITDNNVVVPPIVREFRDGIMKNKGRKSDERDYLSPTTILKLMELLFKYSRSSTFSTRKHFSKKDMNELN